MSDKPEGDHTKLYKNFGKADVSDSRRRRNENSIEIRRQRRQDDLMKRRNVMFDDDEPVEDKDCADSNRDAKPASSSKPLMTIEEAVSILVNNPSVDDLRAAFCGIRRILSSATNPPIDEVIKAGLLDALKQALMVEDERVQFEAAWALTNIVSGTSEQTAAAVNAGVTPLLIQLCRSPCMKVVEQVMWAIANIIGDSVSFRDLMIKENVVPAVLYLVSNIEKLGIGSSFVQILAWTVSNLLRHKQPQVPPIVLEQLVPAVMTLLNYPDTQTQQDTCWALSFLTDGADENMEVAYKFGVIPTVLDFLRSGNSKLIPPALRVLGNFATGADHLTQIVIDTGIFKELVPDLLKRSTSSNVKECCWLISNVVAGTNSQIQHIVNSGVLELVVDVLANGDSRGQVEAGWVLANLVHGGTNDQILSLVHIPTTLPTVCKTLACRNNELIVNMLETLYGMFRVIHACEPHMVSSAEIVAEEANGLDNLETLQHHESEMIYNLAYKIVQEFFNDGADEEVEDITNRIESSNGGPKATNGISHNDAEMNFQF